jgi:hypothetical protein
MPRRRRFQSLPIVLGAVMLAGLVPFSARAITGSAISETTPPSAQTQATNVALQEGAAPSGCGQDGSETHCYVSADQTFTDRPKITGLAANVTEHQLSVIPGSKSITQVTLGNRGLGVDLEYGWLVHPSVFHDHNPHLFIALRHGIGQRCVLAGPLYAQADPQHACPASAWTALQGTSPQPGDAVCGTATAGACGQPKLYWIGLFNGAWWIQYGDHYIGSVPEPGWWGVDFATGDVQTWQGEVIFDLTKGQTACVPMGSGKFGTGPGSASITNMVWGEGSGLNRTEAVPGASNSNFWNFGQEDRLSEVSVWGFHFGGPGAC